MLMILSSFSPCPDDALLARGATYQKKQKNLSITLEMVWPTDVVGGKDSI